MYQLMQDGAKIVISAENCLSTLFWIENGKMYCYNAAVGTLPRDDMNAKDFEEFIGRIMQDGGNIEINKSMTVKKLYRRNMKEEKKRA